MPQRKVNKKPLQPQRGARVCFVKGSYKGEKGWINEAKPPSDEDTQLHVIVDWGQIAKEDAFFVTRVKKSSVKPHKNPKNHAEYAVFNEPKVAKHLVGLAEALAEAGIESCGPELQMLIKQYIDSACNAQIAKGTKAKYSSTAFKVKEMMKQEKTKKRAVAQQDQMSVDPLGADI